MLTTNRRTSTILVATLVFGGLLVRAADSSSALFGLGTDFISGFMFGMAIALASVSLVRANAERA